jgi:hypothetical protein
MSGSQPATVGELHPLHRKALRHPLILDGLSDSASRLRARLRRDCACTFYLVFKEPALPDTDDALEREVGCVLPQVFLRWGNLTILLALSCSCQPLSSSFLGVAISLRKNETRRRTAWGLCEPEGLLEDPATGRVTLGPTNIRGGSGAVNPGRSKGFSQTGRVAQPERSHQRDGRTFTTC